VATTVPSHKLQCLAARSVGGIRLPRGVAQRHRQRGQARGDPQNLTVGPPILLESPELLQLAGGHDGPNTDRDNSLALCASCRTSPWTVRRCSRSGPRSAWGSHGMGRSHPRASGAASGATMPPRLGSASSHCSSRAGFLQRRQIGVGGAGELIVEGRGGKGEQRRRGEVAR
jgi:hypothetical protein